MLLEDQPAQAAVCFRRAYKRFCQAWGPDHPDSSEAATFLFCSLLKAGSFAAAEPIIRTAVIDTRSRIFGEEHENTTKAMVSLAVSLIAQNKPASAEPVLQQVLAVRRRVGGAGHMDTVLVMTQLARVCLSLSKFSDAAQLYREVRGQKREGGKGAPGRRAGVEKVVDL